MAMYSFRITTNGTLSGYRSNLTSTRKTLNDSIQRVMTKRKFSSYAEAPAEANLAFQLRRSLWRADDQINNANSVYSRYHQAYVAMDEIVDGDVDHPGLDGIADSLEVITGTAGAGRFALGQTLLSKVDAIVHSMNSQYGDDFVFAGADGLRVPFSWGKDAAGKDVLTYRGIDVSTPKPDKTAADFTLEDGTLDTTAFEAYKTAFQEKTGFNYDTALADSAKLESMAHETTYVDIGLGFEEDANGNMIETSAFNSALSGLNFLGYGTDADGDSKNLVTLMKELGDIAHRCNPDNGEYLDENGQPAPELADRANVLANKLRDALGFTSEQHVKLTADASYLNTNLDQLKVKSNTLDMQREELEAVDPADAIIEMSWAQMSYNAALRIGNTILSQSLLDYMN